MAQICANHCHKGCGYKDDNADTTTPDLKAQLKNAGILAQRATGTE